MDSLDFAHASPLSRVRVRDWAEYASRELSHENYVQSAVNLACLLTKHLIQIIANVESTVSLQDIAPKNLILLLSHPRSLAVEDVKLQFESPRFGVLMGAAPQAKTEPLQPCAVCSALGKILLEVFSKGQSSESLGDSSNDTQTNSMCQYVDNLIGVPPAGKRHSQPKDGSKPSSAYNLLVLSGMPLSICQLVRDLIDADDECTDGIPFTSVKEAFWDLNQMKENSRLFLFDRTCPKKALDDTCLYDNADEQLFGREQKMSALLRAKNKVSAHVIGNDSGQSLESGFLCEMIFLSGYAGSGKSSLLKSLLTCNDQWFVVSCKFSKEAVTWISLANAFNDLFGKWTQDVSTHSTTSDNPMREAFRIVCSSIFSTIDDEGIGQLFDLVPNVGRAFPRLASRRRHQDRGGISATDKVGSGNNRRMYLFRVLLKSLCSVGYPVLLSVDDLQWADSFFINGLEDLVVNMNDTTFAPGKFCPQGLLIAGAFRSDEVKENGNLHQSIKHIKQSGIANVTTLSVGGLSKVEIIKFLSNKLCLPWRYTTELAGVVYGKTARGNPFHVRSFLKAIIQNKMLEFSVRERRWTFDCDTINLQMISDDVAKLLAATFSKLHSRLMETVKIVSCLGPNADMATIDALNSGEEILPYDMVNELEHACKEGIMEKAGGIYAFTHNIIQQTFYGLIPEGSRKLLHKKIGDELLKSSDSTVHMLAVDQVNKFIEDGSRLTPEKRSQYAESNVTAAKIAITASSFEQAQSYINVGMKLLDAEHWQTQYSLSLALFDLAASVSCMRGDIETLPSYLDGILTHAHSFNDSLKASNLLCNLLASQSKHEEALSNCLDNLSNLGEAFPQDISLPNVHEEISTIKSLLRNITINQIKALPPMTSTNKLSAMMFLNNSITFSVISKPLLLPFLCCRMLSLTLVHGICDDSIVGLVGCAFCLFTFTEDYQLAYKIGRMCELLIKERPNRHAFRSITILGYIKVMMEPAQLILRSYAELFGSSMLAGDIYTAVHIRWSHCTLGSCLGESLTLITENTIKCMQEAAKYQQENFLYSSMPLLSFCFHFTGAQHDNIHVKSYEELTLIGESSSNAMLLFQNNFWRLSCHFWMRDYLEVAKLSDQFKPSHQKRPMEVVREFYEGIAFLSLARDTKQAKWRIKGERAVEFMSKWAMTCKWNFGHRHILLQAELHYLNGDIDLAEVAYEASIKSARESKYYHEEALALELYGFYCCENDWMGKGLNQLQLAVEKYREWGATKKANELWAYLQK